MFFKTALFLSALLLSMSRVKADDTPKLQIPFQAELVPEKPEVLLGEPIVLKLQFQNLATPGLEVPTRNGYVSDFKVENLNFSILDAQGMEVLKLGEKWFQHGPISLNPSVQGKYEASFYWPYRAILAKPGKVTITAQGLLSVPDSVPYGSPRPFKASTALDILPEDPHKLGEIINYWGGIMSQDYSVSVGAKRDDAYLRLTSINDRRVVPHFIRALANKQNKSILELNRYNDDTAFEAIKNIFLESKVEAARIKAEILKRAKEERPQSLELRRLSGIEAEAFYNDDKRHAVALVLSTSFHPGALNFLISQRHDSNTNVRLTIIKKIAKLEKKQARPLLEEMTLDSDARVRDAAKRYLKEFDAKRLAPQ